MRIAIEAQRIQRFNKHGMDFVALETIRQLQKIDTQNEYFIFVAPGEEKPIQESPNMHIIEVDCPTYPLWEQWALPRAVSKVKPDLLHCTSNTAPVVCDIPLLLTLHDVIFLEKRDTKSRSMYQNLGWYYRRAVVPRILPKCEKIITVSSFEKGRIAEITGISPEKIVAVHNGYSDHFKVIDNYCEVTRKYITEDDYIFFLGNTDPKKNTPRTLKAYSIYANGRHNPKPLLIADLKEEIINQIIKEEGIEWVKPLIKCAGYISNSDLPYIYNGASAFLYTSLRESFGIPQLEAMACGTPVITSNTSAIPEVAGAGAILIDPTDPDQIADQLIRLENDPEFAAIQREYGFQRIKQFSWESTARQLLNIYNSLKK